MVIDVQRHEETYSIKLIAGQKISIFIDDVKAYEETIPVDMEAMVDFRNNQSKVSQ